MQGPTDVFSECAGPASPCAGRVRLSHAPQREVWVSKDKDLSFNPVSSCVWTAPSACTHRAHHLMSLWCKETPGGQPSSAPPPTLSTRVTARATQLLLIKSTEDTIHPPTCPLGIQPDSWTRLGSGVCPLTHSTPRPGTGTDPTKGGKLLRGPERKQEAVSVDFVLSGDGLPRPLRPPRPQTRWLGLPGLVPAQWGAGPCPGCPRRQTTPSLP